MSWLHIIVLLGMSSLLSAQVKVSGSFDRDTIVIGDEAKFTLSVEVGDEEILAVPRVFLDSVYSALQTFRANPNDTTGAPQPIQADYEIIDLGQWTDVDEDELFASGSELAWTSSTSGDRRLLENTFTLRFWDPGQNVVLLPPILYRSADGIQEQQYDGGQVPIYVSAPPGLEEVHQDSLDAAPIKPILTEPLNLSDFYMPIGILLAIGLLVGGIVLYRRYAQRHAEQIVAPPEPEIIIPAHEKALSSLSSLRDMQLWQQGQVKEYQSQLTHIIRSYLEDRYDVPALENTTNEIVKSLTNQQIVPDDVQSLRRILQVADLVKFAKATPEESIHDVFMDEAVDFVQRTKKIATENGMDQ